MLKGSPAVLGRIAAPRNDGRSKGAIFIFSRRDLARRCEFLVLTLETRGCRGYRVHAAPAVSSAAMRLLTEERLEAASYPRA
jgi:hypothetical protein